MSNYQKNYWMRMSVYKIGLIFVFCVMMSIIAGKAEAVAQENQWLSIEHFYQAYKCKNPKEFAAIKKQATPRGAYLLARRFKPRPDWNEIKFLVKLHATFYKFFGNTFLQKELLATGDRYILKESTTEHVWGAGKDLSGKNYLGKIIMYVRDCLKENKKPHQFKTSAELHTLLDALYPYHQKMDDIFFCHIHKPFYEFSNFYTLPDNGQLFIPPFEK